jgi:hypothetical protein
MEESEKYPLDQLVAIKQKRLEEAEKVLAEKKIDSGSRRAKTCYS